MRMRAGWAKSRRMRGAVNSFDSGRARSAGGREADAAVMTAAVEATGSWVARGRLLGP